MRLEKYTIGVGDRFAHQAKAQLQACVKLAEQGIEVIPVWNKSNREHSFIGSEPWTEGVELNGPGLEQFIGILRRIRMTLSPKFPWMKLTLHRRHLSC